MARYRLMDVIAHLKANGCSISGERIEGHIAFESKTGHGFTLPVYDEHWIDADLADLILADRWISPIAHDLKRFD